MNFCKMKENISSIKSKRKYDCYNKEQLLQ